MSQGLLMKTESKIGNFHSLFIDETTWVGFVG